LTYVAIEMSGMKKEKERRDTDKLSNTQFRQVGHYV
jgi:hypothetical protein